MVGQKVDPEMFRDALDEFMEGERYNSENELEADTEEALLGAGLTDENHL